MSKPTGQATSGNGEQGLSIDALMGQVQGLCKQGKCKQAVELAKNEHKARQTPESERILVDAYLARIEQFQQKGALEDAGVLVRLVHERFPAHRERLTGLQANAAAGEGRVDQLVAPLAKAGVSDQQREAIESAIRRQLVDLPALAACPALPADHSLRVAAGAIWKAMEAVTTGPVSDEQIALREVSRRSPLAGWKMLVLAIAEFYRNDDEGAKRALAAIATDSAAQRLGQVLTAVLEHKSAGGGAAGALANKLVESDAPLREALESVEVALRYCDEGELVRGTRQAVAACHGARADMGTRLRQHVMARCELVGAPVMKIVPALGIPVLDAYYWRLEAKVEEQRDEAGFAVVCWHRFVQCAIAEGLFQKGSAEEAAVWRRAAGLLSRLPARELKDIRRELLDSEVVRVACKDQLANAGGGQRQSQSNLVFELTDAGVMYQRAVQAEAHPETFKEWWQWAQRARLGDRQCESMADLWHHSLPGDPQPLLILSELAENRSALKLSLKYLAQAEAIDPVNPKVRRARLRLNMGIFWRHCKEKKAHLVEKDLAELALLPGMNEPDRQGFLAALRVAWHTLRKDAVEAARCYAVVVERFGPLCAALLLLSVRDEGRLGVLSGVGLQLEVSGQDAAAVAQAVARCLRLGEEFDLAFDMPQPWEKPLRQELTRDRTSLTADGLLAIGEYFLQIESSSMAYLVSAAGLAAASGLTAARFLLLRAQSLASNSPSRVGQCLRAGLELARHGHDSELMDDIAYEIDQHPVVRERISEGRGHDLGAQVLADILKAERQARTFPHGYTEAERAVVLMDNEDHFRPRGKGVPWNNPFVDVFEDESDTEDEESDRDDEADDGGPDLSGAFDAMDLIMEMGLPPGELMKMIPLISKVIAKYGHFPSPEELQRRDPQLAQQLMNLIQSGGKGGKKRR